MHCHKSELRGLLTRSTCDAFICFRSCIFARKGGETFNLCILILWHNSFVTNLIASLVCLSLIKGKPLFDFPLFCPSELTDSVISCYQFTHMILQRSLMKLNKKCCGEKRTQGYDAPVVFKLLQFCVPWDILNAFFLKRVEDWIKHARS